MLLVISTHADFLKNKFAMQTLRIILIFAFSFKLIKAQLSDHSHQRCPEGYFLYTDELCYPKAKKPCPSETSTSTPIITTTYTPPYLWKLNCPEGSIMMEYKCRKIICSFGEYYRGRCLQPVCPQGLVWRGKRCQQPAYLTTIIEVDDVLINEFNETPIAVATSDGNKVIYHTSTPAAFRPSLPPVTTTEKPKHLTTPTTIRTDYELTTLPHIDICCKVFSPRICKLYVSKWVCFNRQYSRCDMHVCISPIVYLKAPEIIYNPPLLIIPPNPNLNDFPTDKVYNNSTPADCSGCATGHAESCSSYCYMYMCPTNTCTYMDLAEYCNIYPGQDACLPTNGCLWDWCQS